MRSVLKNEHGALSVHKIHAKLPALDLTTIYRNLELFVRSGDVKKLTLNGKQTLYEYQVEPHHHAVCTDCKRVIHFSAPDTELKKLLRIKNFAINDIEVTVRGKCKHTKS
jgi:Fe2+ or Zn2+ uptake regulation protein